MKVLPKESDKRKWKILKSFMQNGNMYCGQISFFIPHPFSGESSSGNHSVEEKKHFSSERRKPWYTEDDVDNSSWTQIECCIWSVGQSDPAVIRCSLATTLEWILKAGFYLLIISRTPPNAFAAVSWGRFSTMRNTDKDKLEHRQRQKDRCTFLSLNSLASCLLAQTAFVSSAVREV